MSKIIDISTRKEKKGEKLIAHLVLEQSKPLKIDIPAKSKAPVFLCIFVPAIVFSILIWFVFVKTTIWQDIALPIIESIPAGQKQKEDKFIILNKRNKKNEIRTNKEKAEINKSKYSEEITSWVDEKGKMHFSN